MRLAFIALALALSACASASVTQLTPADAATTLIAGGRLTMTVEPPVGGGEGEDPLVLMSLKHTDGRVMRFNQSNHAPYHVMAQAPGGPLAQVMGLFGDESPLLFGARTGESSGAPFICPPDGPASVGVYDAGDGTVRIVGLRQEFAFEPRADGSTEALPYPPDQVCARLNFRRR
jgi:hypothetical protein